ncbi:MAG: hypothetical protein WBG37_11500 [Desulfobacterales bacterium]
MIIPIILLLLMACGQDSEAPSPMAVAPEGEAEGFTFLGLGKSSHYTDKLREQLRQRLGHDVAERKMPLKLAIHPPGFVAQHLPAIAALNQRLNYAPRERIEQNILRLTYRYAEKKGTPFDRVELVFSQYTQKPLMFYIQSGKTGGEMIAAIQQKYGAYTEVTDPAREVTTRYWRDAGDVLALTLGTDRFGDPEYHIWIFYASNLEELAATEEERRRIRQKNLNEAGKEAF